MTMGVGLKYISLQLVAVMRQNIAKSAITHYRRRGAEVHRRLTEAGQRNMASKAENGKEYEAIRDDVKEYYGKRLKSTADLKSNACVPSAKPIPVHIRNALKEVHPDVIARYYGCGLVVPECLEDCRVLDLGSGTGRDCYMLSRLVGEKGHITGIDMTDDQLNVARKYIDYHTEKFGHKKANVDFVQGYIEALQEAGLKEGSFDIIISNCVVNLSPDKTKVLREAYRVLKDGGELYFSDVYSSSRLPEDITSHKVLWGECLGGALWWEDLISKAQEVGFSTPRLVTAAIITVDNPELEKLLEGYRFVSATYRLFKVPKCSSEEKSLVIYDGNITGSEKTLEFDAQHTFKVDEVMEVSAELANILKCSRFASEFTFQPTGGPGSPCCAKPQAVSSNPFKLVEQVGTATPSSNTGGCCSSQESCCK
ncbi:arsenite methyltransferase [Engraulis encrasicolus]|uniref:arsenite methyltransferase n=1 Tax=Engraulis encrasicolus TaxID=184585 RepID=UPI002FD3A27E